MIEKRLDHLTLLPMGNDLLQQLTDVLALFANANSKQRELIKPDLHDKCKHLCSLSLVITQL